MNSVSIDTRGRLPDFDDPTYIRLRQYRHHMKQLDALVTLGFEPCEADLHDALRHIMEEPRLRVPEGLRTRILGDHTGRKGPGPKAGVTPLSKYMNAFWAVRMVRKILPRLQKYRKRTRHGGPRERLLIAVGKKYGFSSESLREWEKKFPE